MFTATSSDSWNIMIEGSSNTNQEVGTGDGQPCFDELEIHLLSASGDGSKSRFLFPVQDQIGHRWSRWGRVGRCCGLPGRRRPTQQIRDSPTQKWVPNQPRMGVLDFREVLKQGQVTGPPTISRCKTPWFPVHFSPQPWAGVEMSRPYSPGTLMQHRFSEQRDLGCAGGIPGGWRAGQPKSGWIVLRIGRWWEWYRAHSIWLYLI